MTSPASAPRGYRALVLAAVAAALAWVAWLAYDALVRGKTPGDYAYHAAGNYFADGDYPRALAAYERALAAAPDHVGATRGRAETLIVLGRERDAVAALRGLLEEYPDSAAYHANLGIAYDRLGEYEAALHHYDTAQRLDDRIGSGPHWLTRLLRNQPEKPPGVAERAAYLRGQLALPPSERLLRVPELDRAQRPYKQ